MRELANDPDLTNADLGTEIWHRLNIDELSKTQNRSLRDQIYGMRIMPSHEAIPAGVPISWVTLLPIGARSRNAIIKLAISRDSSRPFETSISCKEVLDIRSTGIVALFDLLCVLESAESSEEDAELEEDLVESYAPPIAPTSPTPPSPIDNHLREFFIWALSESDSRTVGDAVAHMVHGNREIEEWRAVSEARLEDVVERPPHPFSVIDAWMNRLSVRERDVMRFRLCQPDPPTLQALADVLRITRERVRQIEAKLLDQLSSLMEDSDGKPLRWRVDTIRDTIGVAALTASVEHLLGSAGQEIDYRPLLLRLAGPYEMAGEWMVLKSAVADDPTRSIFDSADEHSCINRESAAMKLDEWGLDRQLHEAWLLKDNKLREINSHLVRWDVSVGDKLAFALFDIGKPATVDELIERIGWDGSKYTPTNAMFGDDRFTRVNNKMWGLASWENPVYSGIASSIRELIEAEVMPLRVADVARRLSKKFDIAEGSVRGYCYAPMFVIDGGWIRLRGIDEPYEYDPVSLRSRSSRGVFILDPRRVSLLIEVDSNVLRGAGRQLTFAVGSVLDVKPNDGLTFRTVDGETIPVTFPETSRMGPALGSTRAFAENAGAKLGDYMTLVFDRSDMSVDTRVTDVSLFEPSWELVARLTGIDARIGMDGLAEALDCEASEVLTVLRERRDHAVAEAIPPLHH